MAISIIVMVFILVAAICSLFSGLLALVFFTLAALIPAADLLLSASRLKTPLEIQTPDGSGEPFHPSVVFFEKPWNGYRYWMGFTPYPVNKPPYRDRWECPCVVASNDGIRWKYPDTCSFLDDLTEEQIQSFDYFSDTHLTYDSNKDMLYCYYRLDTGTEPKTVTIFRRETCDGRNWGDRIALTYPEKVDALEPLSQSVLRENGHFTMWYVAHSGDPNGIYMLRSHDGLMWNSNKKCTLSGTDVTPWHIDCQYIDDCYYLTIYELSQRITLWTSPDGENFTFVKQLLTIPVFGNCGLFYNNILYRACFIKDTDTYKLYFACGNKKNNTIGIMTGKNIDQMNIVSVSNRPYSKMLMYDLLAKYSYFPRIVLHKIKKIVKR